MNKYQALKKFFGYSSFRDGQERIVDSLISGRDTLCIMPTGAGKSICYQIPALLLPGITLVVSPLISLMQDQVDKLVRSGIRAAYINSSLTLSQYKKVLRNMREGIYKIIYVAPERLETDSFRRICSCLNVSLLTVDEAHCVSQWGKDFRPSYLHIAEFLRAIGQRPVIGAFTATATDYVRSDIVNILELLSPITVTTGFDRPNLRFEVRYPDSKERELAKIVSERKGKSGIVYCATRKSVEKVCEELQAKGFSATRYHAGLSDEERRMNQEDFLFGRRSIMVATNAFGMGIDKADIRYIVHFSMPMSIEHYYQEAGRAGRDGETADCILLYQHGDKYLHEYMLTKSYPNREFTAKEVKEQLERDLASLERMKEYCETEECLRAFILQYFGETARSRCDNCSNCVRPTKITLRGEGFFKAIFDRKSKK